MEIDFQDLDSIQEKKKINFGRKSPPAPPRQRLLCEGVGPVPPSEGQFPRGCPTPVWEGGPFLQAREGRAWLGLSVSVSTPPGGTGLLDLFPSHPHPASGRQSLRRKTGTAAFPPYPQLCFLRSQLRLVNRDLKTLNGKIPELHNLKVYNCKPV